MTKLFSLKGSIQNYLWGGTRYIPKLIGLEPGDQKVAEYWLGAHAKAPSVVKTTHGEKALDAFLESHLKEYLGVDVAKKYGRLPFLFKVLDVHDMLSIQVHPTKPEAEKGFKHENELGIPLNAPNRNYKDDNHKPEIMLALSEFWLLHGFLPKDRLTQVLQERPEFNSLLGIFIKEGYSGLYKTVMEQSEQETNTILRPLIKRILPLYKAGKLAKSSPDYWAAKAFDKSEDKASLDKGIFSIYFFNLVRLNKGEAIFQDAGIPHAYLEGQNIELMANSDNVLRGGLTPKHVDVPELLKHVLFEETIPNLICGELQKDGIERIYKSAAPDFELSSLELKISDTYHSKAKTAQILMVLEGEAMISEGRTSLKCTTGDAALLLAGSDYRITTESVAVLYKATVPGVNDTIIQ
jgi:mannose-6-phosphate isomerase